METKHTHGPWKVANVFIENKPNRYFVTESKWGGRNIADCGMSTGEQWDINEANARLIAACPDLYEACKALVELHTDNETDNSILWSARQAIAKAEGK